MRRRAATEQTLHTPKATAGHATSAPAHPLSPRSGGRSIRSAILVDQQTPLVDSNRLFILKAWTLLLLLALHQHAAAQAGAVDLSFNAADVGHGYGDGPTYTVSAVLPLPGGGAVIAGNFTYVDGVARTGIARLLADGSIDPAFDPGTGI